MNTKTTRILSVVLALVLCFGLMATAAFAADKESTAAPIDLQVYGVGASESMTINVAASLAITEKQAEAAAVAGADALAEMEFVCTLKDDSGFIAANEELVKTASISMSEGAPFERVSSEVKDGAIVVVYKLAKDAVKADAKAEDIKAMFNGMKVSVSGVAEKAEIKETVESHVIATVTLNDKVLAEGETDVLLSDSMPFVDVPSNEYFAPAVLWALDKKVTNGTTETTFSPYDACTRAQVVTFLWRAAGMPKAEKPVNPFTDVKEGAYYYDAVLWAVEKEVTNGTSATTFSPDQGCTRGMVVTFLWRFEGKPEVKDVTNPFSDVAEGVYYTPAVLWAVSEEVTNGTSPTTFSPDDVCQRAHVITFLYRDQVGAETAE